MLDTDILLYENKENKRAEVDKLIKASETNSLMESKMIYQMGCYTMVYHMLSDVIFLEEHMLVPSYLYPYLVH